MTYPNEREVTDLFLRDLFGLTLSPTGMWGSLESIGWVSVTEAERFDPWHKIEDAFMVIGRLHLRGYRYKLSGFFDGTLCHGCHFDEDRCADANLPWQELGSTPAEAICRAAYKVLTNDMSPAGTWWRQAGQGDPWKLERDPLSKPQPIEEEAS